MYTPSVYTLNFSRAQGGRVELACERGLAGGGGFGEDPGRERGSRRTGSPSFVVSDVTGQLLGAAVVVVDAVPVSRYLAMRSGSPTVLPWIGLPLL